MSSWSERKKFYLSQHNLKRFKRKKIAQKTIMRGIDKLVPQIIVKADPKRLIFRVAAEHGLNYEQAHEYINTIWDDYWKDYCATA